MPPQQFWRARLRAPRRRRDLLCWGGLQPPGEQVRGRGRRVLGRSRVPSGVGRLQGPRKALEGGVGGVQGYLSHKKPLPPRTLQ